MRMNGQEKGVIAIEAETAQGASEHAQANGHAARHNLTLQDRGPGPSVTLTLQNELIEHGRRRAIDGGALEPDEQDLRALEELARASARGSYGGLFDPSQNAHDLLREGEYQKLLSDRREAEQAEKFAAAALNEREEEMAQATVLSARPQPSTLLLAAAVVVIAVTVAPTLHDFVFVMSDDVLSWGMSLLTGAFLGALIALMILVDVHGTGRRSSINWIGLAAGIGMSVGLGTLRVSRAAEVGDFVFAIALSIIEAAIILALEGVAIGLRGALQDWSIQRSAEAEASGRLEAAQARLTRCRERVAELNDAIGSHIGYVEDRWVRYLRVEEIEAVSIKAILDGYRAGIAHNQGHVLGAGRKHR